MSCTSGRPQNIVPLILTTVSRDFGCLTRGQWFDGPNQCVEACCSQQTGKPHPGSELISRQPRAPRALLSTQAYQMDRMCALSTTISYASWDMGAGFVDSLAKLEQCRGVWGQCTSIEWLSHEVRSNLHSN